MEKEANTLAIPTHHQHPPAPGRTKKKHGIQNFVRAILYMIKRRSDKKAQVDVASKGVWKKLVGAMRPLHHQHLPQTQSSPPRRPPPPPPLDIWDARRDVSSSPSVFLDVFPSPSHEYGLASPSTTSDGGRSRYASALNLQELDKSEEGDDIEVVIEDGEYEDGGDLAIDAKAEEFIANFYEQMRLQRLEYEHHDNEHTE